MPDEFNRVLSRKRIYSPDDESIFLDIPVIDRISFRDQKSSAQDKVFLINNTSDSSRKTHVRRVENPASHDYVDVERIDQIAFRDQKDSAQDTVFRLLNDEPQHLKTHVVRYYKDNDTSTDTWADSELVDEFIVTDQKDNAQTTHFVLNNDPVGPTIDDPDDPFSPTLGNVDLTLPLKDAGDGIDPPYRIDPFQNIVNFNAEGLQIVLVGGNNPPDNTPQFIQINAAGVLTSAAFGGGALTGHAAPVDRTGRGHAVVSGDDAQITHRYKNSTALFSTAAFPLCFDQSGNLFVDDGSALDLNGTVVKSGGWSTNRFVPGVCDGDGSYYTVQQAAPGSNPFLIKFAFKSGVSSWSVNFSSDQSPLGNVVLGPDGNVWAALINASNDVVINKYSGISGRTLASISFPHFDLHSYGADVVAGTGVDPVIGDVTVTGTFSVAPIEAWTVDRVGRVVVAMTPISAGIIAGWGASDFLPFDLQAIETTLNSPIVLRALNEAGGTVWEKDIPSPPLSGNYYTTDAKALTATRNMIVLARIATKNQTAYLDGSGLFGTQDFDDYSFVTGYDNSGNAVWSYKGNRSGAFGSEGTTSFSGAIQFSISDFLLLSSTPIFRTAK